MTRSAAPATSDYPVKERVKTRRAEMEAAKKIHPQEWYGTATEWQVYNEPYKTLWGYPHKFEAELKRRQRTRRSARPF